MLATLGLPQISTRVQTDPAGVLEIGSRPHPVIVIHVGKPVRIGCRRDGARHVGLAVHGDVDIVPAGVPARWEVNDRDTALILGIPRELLLEASQHAGIELVNRFQTRDPLLERLAWELESEKQRGYPNGRLYSDDVSSSLAAHLLRHHSTRSHTAPARSGGLPGHLLKQVLAYIEENPGGDLSLAQIAGIAGMSVSHCKQSFRQSVGTPIHQYVIGRRLDRAISLLRESDLPISQIAMDTGFSHASHLAQHMRRIAGISPREIREQGRTRTLVSCS